MHARRATVDAGKCVTCKNNEEFHLISLTIYLEVVCIAAVVAAGRGRRR